MTDISNWTTAAGSITLGTQTVPRIGLGTNRITDIEAAHQLLKQAVELGIEFFDTAYVYSGGNSEVTIGNTLAPYPDNLLIATKGGVGGFDEGFKPKNNEADIRAQLDESLSRLKTDCIDLYQLHRVDPEVPIETTVAVLKSLQDEGKIEHIGLSEVTVEQLQAAQTVATIVSVQNEYNVSNRKHEDLVDYCTEHGIVFIPWYPLGGLEGDTQKVEALVANLAEKYEVSSQQIALKWLLMRSEVILPIPGTLSLSHLEDNLTAALIDLSQSDYETLSPQD